MHSMPQACMLPRIRRRYETCFKASTPAAPTLRIGKVSAPGFSMFQLVNPTCQTTTYGCHKLGAANSTNLGPKYYVCLSWDMSKTPLLQNTGHTASSVAFELRASKSGSRSVVRPPTKAVMSTAFLMEHITAAIISGATAMTRMITGPLACIPGGNVVEPRLAHRRSTGRGKQLLQDYDSGHELGPVHIWGDGW